MGQVITSTDLNTLKTYAQTTLGKSYTGKWKSIINNIRWDAYKALGAAVGGNVSMEPRQICSGPWCITGGETEISGMYGDVMWVGPYEEGRLIKTRTGGFCNLYNHVALTGGWNGSHTNDINCKSGLWKFKIGGDTGVVFKLGTPSGRGSAFITVIDDDLYNPVEPSITVSSDIPGFSHTSPVYGGFGAGWSISMSADSTASPGEYYISLTIASAHHLYWDLIQVGLDISVETASSAPHGAIHNTSQIVKMVAPQTPGTGELHFGLFSRKPFPNPQSNPSPWTWREDEQITVNTWAVTTPSSSSQGRWFAKTLPICWREIQLQAYMPPNTPPPPGPWNGPIYGFYRDNNPAKGPSQSDSVIMEVEPAVTFRAACHPCFRDTDTLPSWLGMYSPPFWYIREVVVLRHGDLDENHIMKPKSGTVPFWLGCFRGGSFTAFPDGAGSVGGDGLKLSVKWPVFDMAPLIYQCDEPLMVYAYVSYEAGQFASDMWSHSIEMPPLIDHLNDTYALLDLV